MKNLRYTSYRKNRYFEGKLLTAGDLSEEQRYFNDKRRLHNRYFHGAGVVSGLEVIAVDDYSISLEMGVAVDGIGREIVVEEPVILKLSSLEGFEEAVCEEGSESLNLYLAYEEELAEPVHNMMDQSLHTLEEIEYNKIKEGYKLYVSDAIPEELEPKECSMSRAEWICDHPFTGGICLAGIDLVKAGEFYMIERIRLMPGNQRAHSIPEVTARLASMEEEFTAVKRKLETVESTGQEVAEKEASEESRPGWQLSQGNAVISFGKRGKRGQCYYSQEISHGLGIGRVDLMLSLNQEEDIYGGASEVFSQEELSLESAYRLSSTKGTFTIGVRLLEDTTKQEVSVNWLAVRNSSGREKRKEEKRLFIKPSMVNIRVLEDYRLEAVGGIASGNELLWTVVSPKGGSVDPDGCYHAPAQPGVYQVTAEIKGKPEVKASVYVVVRQE